MGKAGIIARGKFCHVYVICVDSDPGVCENCGRLLRYHLIANHALAEAGASLEVPDWPSEPIQDKY